MNDGATREQEIEEAWRQHNLTDYKVFHNNKRNRLEEHFHHQQGICHYCKGEMTIVNKMDYIHQNKDAWACATLDHIVPQSLDGPDTFENTCAACDGCNNAKLSFPPELFLAWCEYAIMKYDDIAERRRYLKLESEAELHRIRTTFKKD